MSTFSLRYGSLWILTLLSHTIQSASNETDQTRPNIIFMLADDLGFNELGYTGCTDTFTPNLDELATSDGLILSTNYVSKICSPSRSSLMTGRYPSTLGLQNLVFNVQYPVSLTRQVSILSEEFKANGYSTHCIGKWHLGFTAWEYTPRYRGFDTFSGFYGGIQHYYNHSESMGPATFYDLRIGEEEDTESISKEVYGPFLERDQALNLLSDLKDADDPFFLYIGWQASHLPNEAPSEFLELYNDSINEDRMHCQAQTTTLDESVGDIVDYLKDNEMWDDTLIIFSSDNGGNYDRADNYPLRGFKNTSFEGGIRVPAFVTGGYLEEDRRGKVLDDVMVSIVDWYPTLLSAANLDVGHHRSLKLYNSTEPDTRFADSGIGDVPLDGQDIWWAIQYGEITDEIAIDSRELLLDLNEEGECSFASCGAIRSGRYKFIRGLNMGVNSSITNGNQWQSDFAICSEDLLGCFETEIDVNSLNCIAEQDGCLFDLEADPCEKVNVGSLYPKIRDDLIGRLNYYQSVAAGPLIRKSNIIDSKLFLPTVMGKTFWTPYMEYERVEFEKELIPKWIRMFPEETESESEMKVDFEGEWKQRGYLVENVVFAVIAGLLLIGMYMIWRCCFEKRKKEQNEELTPLIDKI